jgi:hypothetical protein
MNQSDPPEHNTNTEQIIPRGQEENQGVKNPVNQEETWKMLIKLKGKMKLIKALTLSLTSTRNREENGPEKEKD